MNTHLSFACDYMEGTHPAILQKLVETNLEKTGLVVGIISIVNGALLLKRKSEIEF